MVTKYFRTRKLARLAKKKVGKAGVSLWTTSKTWRKGDKRRKGKNFVVRY